MDQELKMTIDTMIENGIKAGTNKWRIYGECKATLWEYVIKYRFDPTEWEGLCAYIADKLEI